MQISEIGKQDTGPHVLYCIFVYFQARTTRTHPFTVTDKQQMVVQINTMGVFRRVYEIKPQMKFHCLKYQLYENRTTFNAFQKLVNHSGNVNIACKLTAPSRVTKKHNRPYITK